jgi:hypothetical protein
MRKVCAPAGVFGRQTSEPALAPVPATMSQHQSPPGGPRAALDQPTGSRQPVPNPPRSKPMKISRMRTRATLAIVLGVGASGRWPRPAAARARPRVRLRARHKARRPPAPRQRPLPPLRARRPRRRAQALPAALQRPASPRVPPPETVTAITSQHDLTVRGSPPRRTRAHSDNQGARARLPQRRRLLQLRPRPRQDSGSTPDVAESAR